MIEKTDFYYGILKLLEETTNLTKIRSQLGISKQDLNYYLKKLRQTGQITLKGRGWYEVVKNSKNSIQYGENLPKDIVRGHAYVWNVYLPKEIKGWENRIEVLKKNNINFKLVGGKIDIPRIKVLGRKVWLCNNHVRVFEARNTSFYGLTAIESKSKATLSLLEVVHALESKLGFNFSPLKISDRKEHYALIKNDLAIDHNKKGIILRISDKDGEWLLIDDSLGEGGELENIGKKAFETNLPMQKWWNNHKDTNFKITPDFIMKSLDKVTENQLMFANNIETHMQVLKDISNAIISLKEEVKKLNEEKFKK
jgi:biotin operon repressor